MPKIPEATRAYFYRVVTALAVLAVAKGWLTPDDAPLWIEVGAAVLGIGTPALASVNTSTKR